MELHGPTTILQALAMAGGFKEFANTKDVKVLRPNGDRGAVADDPLQLQGRPQRRRQAVLSPLGRHRRRSVTAE